MIKLKSTSPDFRKRYPIIISNLTKYHFPLYFLRTSQIIKYTHLNFSTTDNKNKDVDNPHNSEHKSLYLIMRDNLSKFFSKEKGQHLDQPIEKLIRADHVFIKSIYDELNRALTREQKIRWRNLLSYELIRHSIAEEIILFPLIRSYVPDGELIFDNMKIHDHSIKEKILHIQHLNPGYNFTYFNSEIESFWKDILLHIENEESEIIPRLIRYVDEKKRIEYGNQFSRRKYIVPTRPHTIIPEDPPSLNSVLSLLAMPVDKFKDIFTLYPDGEKVRELEKEAMS